MNDIKKFATRYQFTLIAIFVCVFSHLIYLKGGFVWIDHADIEEKQAIVPNFQLLHAFTHSFGQTSFYRPIVTIVNSIDTMLYGLNPFGFHLTNLLLHVAVVVIGGIFLRIFLNLNDAQVFFSRIFIAVHPMSILIVGAITRRQETLSAVFMLLSVILYIYGRRHNRLRDTFSFVCVFLLALFTKETALVIVPALIIIWEITKYPVESQNGWKTGALAMIPVGIYVFFRLHAVPQVWNTLGEKMPFCEYVGTRIGLAGKWLLYSMSPFKPHFTDAIPIYSFFDIHALLILLIFIALGVYILLAGYKSTGSKAILITMIFIAPGLAIVPIPRLGTPNYGYLPAIGMAGCGAIFWWYSKKRWRHLAKGIFIWFIIAGTLTFISGDQFINDETLFKPEVEKSYFPEGHYFLGNYYLKKGEYEFAKREYERSLEKIDLMIAFRNDQPTIINLASVTMAMGDNEKARELLKKALVNSDDSQKELLTFNLALTYYNEENYTETVEVLTSREWSIKNAYMMLSNSYDTLGKTKEKEEALKKADSL